MGFLRRFVCKIVISSLLSFILRPLYGRLLIANSNRSDYDLSEEEKKKLDKIHNLRFTFLGLVRSVGLTPSHQIVVEVMSRLTVRIPDDRYKLYSREACIAQFTRIHDGGLDCHFSINILVLGKTGVGKSATINSIFGETITHTSISVAYGAVTVTEIVGMVNGVKIRIFDTPGLKSGAFEQRFNEQVLYVVKELTNKSPPPDVVLYVDRLDNIQTSTGDLSMLRLIDSALDALGPSRWLKVLVTLTHATSAPSGSPLSYVELAAQRSCIIRQAIGQAVGDLSLINRMTAFSLVENHPSCPRNMDGHKMLPDGQSWRHLFLFSCYSNMVLCAAHKNLYQPHEYLNLHRN